MDNYQSEIEIFINLLGTTLGVLIILTLLTELYKYFFDPKLETAETNGHSTKENEFLEGLSNNIKNKIVTNQKKPTDSKSDILNFEKSSIENDIGLDNSKTASADTFRKTKIDISKEDLRFFLSWTIFFLHQIL